MTEHILAIDLGTAGPKVGLVATDGSLSAQGFEPVSLHILPGGGAEQDPAEWWEAVVAATRRLLTTAPVPTDQIIGIFPTGQWSGTVPVDGSSRPLMRALIWMDSRGAPDIRRLIRGPVRVAGYDPRTLRRWVAITGGAPTKSGKDPLGHILWLRRERPHIFDAAAAFLEPKDYLVLRLTGRVVGTPDSVALHWLTDNRDPDRIDYHPDLLRRSGIRRDTLPDLIAATDVAGPLDGSAAADLGLPAGIPVLAGTPDLHSAAIGAGGAVDFTPHLYLGTSAWISCHVPFKKTDVLRNIAALPAALPGRYVVADEQQSAGGCLDFLAQTVFPGSEGEPAAAYRRFDALAADALPGSGGVMFAPWLSGERTPVEDARLRAAFLNLAAGTTPAELVRAVFEGVAYNTRWLLGAVERFTGRRLDPLTLVGGGGNSPGWAQIIADVLGRTIARAAEPSAVNLRGAGLLGALALGRIEQEDIAAAVPVAEIHRPDPRTAGLHDDRFGEFLAFYRSSRGGFGVRRRRPSSSRM